MTKNIGSGVVSSEAFIQLWRATNGIFTLFSLYLPRSIILFISFFTGSSMTRVFWATHIPFMSVNICPCLHLLITSCCSQLEAQLKLEDKYFTPSVGSKTLGRRPSGGTRSSKDMPSHIIAGLPPVPLCFAGSLSPFLLDCNLSFSKEQ